MSQVPSITPLSPPMQWPILSGTYSSTGPSHYQQRPPSDIPHTLLTIAPFLVQCGTSVVMWPVPRPPVHCGTGVQYMYLLCNRVLVFRCDMNTATLFFIVTQSHCGPVWHGCTPKRKPHNCGRSPLHCTNQSKGRFGNIHYTRPYIK